MAVSEVYVEPFILHTLRFDRIIFMRRFTVFAERYLLEQSILYNIMRATTADRGTVYYVILTGNMPVRN